MHRWTIGSMLAMVAVPAIALAGIEPGDKAPDFKNLPGTDGKAHSLADFSDADVVVVAFTCNHCPVAVAYEDRFIDFAKKYTDKGVEFVAVSCNNIDDDKLPAMKERASEKGFPFLYLHDESQESGKAYGAMVTPHVFVLDKNRNVVFMGPFDNKMAADRVTKTYVADVVDALLDGKSPEPTKIKPHGCGIPYE